MPVSGDSKFLLDSSVLVRVLRGDSLLADSVLNLSQVFVVPTVVGELYYGAHKSENFARELAGVSHLLQNVISLTYSYQTGVEYAVIKDNLRRKGRPIPDADMWIAAAAKQYQMTLIHRDRHFEEIEGLTAEMW